MATDQETFTFTVMVHTCCVDHAKQVMAERLDFAEDYGFTYWVDWRERQ